MGESLPSPALDLASPFSVNNSGCTDASPALHPTPPSADSSNLQKLSSNLYSLISPDFDDSFSDVLIYVSHFIVPLHRCILAARCPFFKSFFSKDSTYLGSFAPQEQQGDTKPTKVKIDLGKLLSSWPNLARVSYDAFMTTMSFLYSGEQTLPAVKCIDDHCAHEACRPVVHFAVEMLCLSSVFVISDLKTVWQHNLLEIVEKAQVDEVIPVLIAAKVHGIDVLLSSALQLVAVSNMGTVDLRKQLPMALAEDVLLLRCKMGLLQPETLNPTHERECQRIRKALDSDDVELVQLLLKEGRMSLDGALALHYAVAYCDPHTVRVILDLGLADVNTRNSRGFTVLHLAAMRQDPSILVSLLSKGANARETTPDGWTALQLCSRMMRRYAYVGDLQKERLCLEILYQAGAKNLFEDTTFPPVANEEELFSRLIYLENRVALGRLLFPEEAKLVLGISHLESTSEFVGFGTSDFSNKAYEQNTMDLNQVPRGHSCHDEGSTAHSSTSTPVMNEALVKRVEALQRTVTLGRRMFPRIISILDAFTDDDDSSELRSIKSGSCEEQRRKKRRYMELKQALADAFQQDVAAMEPHKSDKLDTRSKSPSLSP